MSSPITLGLLPQGERMIQPPRPHTWAVIGVAITVSSLLAFAALQYVMPDTVVSGLPAGADESRQPMLQRLKPDTFVALPDRARLARRPDRALRQRRHGVGLWADLDLPHGGLGLLAAPGRPLVAGGHDEADRGRGAGGSRLGRQEDRRPPRARPG